MNAKLLSCVLITGVLMSAVNGMEIPAAVKVEGPEIYIDIKNGTPNDYAIYADGRKISDISKAGTVRTANLKQEWEKLLPAVSQKSIHFSIRDRSGAIKLKLIVGLLPTMLSVGLSGNANDTALQFIDLAKGTPSFIIHLYLKGDNLENSEIDVTTVQK